MVAIYHVVISVTFVLLCHQVFAETPELQGKQSCQQIVLFLVTFIMGNHHRNNHDHGIYFIFPKKCTFAQKNSTSSLFCTLISFIQQEVIVSFCIY